MAEIFRVPSYVESELIDDNLDWQPQNLLVSSLYVIPVQNPFTATDFSQYEEVVFDDTFDTTPNLLLTTLYVEQFAPAQLVEFEDTFLPNEDGEIVFQNLLLTTLAIVSVTGNANVTTSNDTISGSGTTTVLGILAVTSSNDTVLASGTTTVLGTLTTTGNNDTVSANGTVGGGVDGTANVTAQNDTVSSSGTTTVVGSANITSQNDTVSSSGTTTVVGSLAKTNNNDSVSAFGIVGTPPTVTTYLPLTGAGK